MTIVSGAVNHYISSKSLVNGKLLLWYLRFTQVETGYHIVSMGNQCGYMFNS